MGSVLSPTTVHEAAHLLTRLGAIGQVPLDTNAFVTLWLPLRAMDDDDSGLLFASGKNV